jgi:hypothetical protein
MNSKKLRRLFHAFIVVLLLDVVYFAVISDYTPTYLDAFTLFNIMVGCIFLLVFFIALFIGIYLVFDMEDTRLDSCDIRVIRKVGHDDTEYFFVQRRTVLWFWKTMMISLNMKQVMDEYGDLLTEENIPSQRDQTDRRRRW